MAKQGFKAMDSDMHVFEPHDLWDRYIDPEFKDRAPKGLQRDFRDLGVEVEGKILPIPRRPENSNLRDYRLSTLKEKYADVAARDFDGVSQVMAMDKEGLDLAFLFPTRGLFVLGIDGLDPGAGRGHLPGLQRLALRLLTGRARPHDLRRHGAAP